MVSWKQLVHGVPRCLCITCKSTTATHRRRRRSCVINSLKVIFFPENLPWTIWNASTTGRTIANWRVSFTVLSVLSSSTIFRVFLNYSLAGTRFYIFVFSGFFSAHVIGVMRLKSNTENDWVETGEVFPHLYSTRVNDEPISFHIIVRAAASFYRELLVVAGHGQCRCLLSIWVLWIIPPLHYRTGHSRWWMKVFFCGGKSAATKWCG